MILHNMSDIVVCVTKSAKLLAARFRRRAALGWSRLSVRLLPFMILTWFVTR
eukprot:gene12714-10690_t